MKRWFRRGQEQEPRAEESQPQEKQTETGREQAEEPEAEADEAAQADLPTSDEDTGEGGGGLWGKLRKGLSRSRDNIRNQLVAAFKRSEIDEELWEEIETILIGADVGVETTMSIIDDLRDQVRSEGITETSRLWELLVEDIASRIKAAPPMIESDRMTVLIVVGVNGTGKTTTIAKLARKAKNEGRRVLLAAGDTYRAAAIEQLNEWSRRIGVDVVAHERKADPSAVIFDAVKAAIARQVDLLLADTAGRLHTYENLMQELAKMRRVAERELDGAGEVKTLLVLDATTGQNGLIQARQFSEAVGIDAIALTKLDGTAKGGIVLGIQDALKIPIAYIGVGEGYDDLQRFDPVMFAQAFIGAGSEQEAGSESEI